MTQKEVAKALVALMRKRTGLLRGTLELTETGVYFNAAPDYKGSWFEDFWKIPEFRRILRLAYDSGFRIIKIEWRYPKLLVEVDGKTFKYHWD